MLQMVRRSLGLQIQVQTQQHTSCEIGRNMRPEAFLYQFLGWYHLYTAAIRLAVSEMAANHNDTMTAGTTRTAAMAGSAGNRAVPTKAVLRGTESDDLAEALLLSSVRTGGIAGSAGEQSTLTEDTLIGTLAKPWHLSIGLSMHSWHSRLNRSAGNVSRSDLGEAEEPGLSASCAARVRTADSAGTARKFKLVNPAVQACTAGAMSAADIMQDLASDGAATGDSVTDDDSMQDPPGLPASHASHASAQTPSAAQTLHGTEGSDVDSDILSDSAIIANESAAEATRRHIAADTIHVQDMASEDEENVSLWRSHTTPVRELPQIWQYAICRDQEGLSFCFLAVTSQCRTLWHLPVQMCIQAFCVPCRLMLLLAFACVCTSLTSGRQFTGVPCFRGLRCFGCLSKDISFVSCLVGLPYQTARFVHSCDWAPDSVTLTQLCSSAAS